MLKFLKGLVSKPKLDLNVEEHERLLRIILENAHDLVAIVDFNGRRLYNNRSYSPILGDPTGLRGTNSFEEIHPEDREKIKRVFAETVRTGKGQKASYRFIGKNGSIRYIESQGYVIPAREGSVAKVVILSHDVTDQKQAEEDLRKNERRFHALIENISDAITLLGRDGSVVYASPAAQKIFSLAGKQPGEVSVFDIIHPDDLEFVHTILTGLVAKPKETVTEQLRIMRSDGSIGWVEGAFNNLLTDPYVRSIVATFRDITDRKQLEEDLRHIQKMESIGRLAGGVAHDFNNILAIVLGYSAAVVRAKNDTKKIADHVDVIQKASQRGASLVRQLLMFARKTEAFFETVNVNEVVLDAVRMLEETFPKSIHFSMDLNPELPRVYADPGQVHQTIVNLCVNARDAIMETADGKSKGGELNITTDFVAGDTVRTRFISAKEKEYIRIRVTDTGAGMNDITRARMFEPFFTTKANGKGTGLGLSVVFGILQNHHGFIDVDSTLGQGTTFTIYFPASAVTAGKSTSENDIPDGKLDGNETVLVVEDEIVLRTLLRSLLESYGYEVMTAEDGKAAVSLFEKQKERVSLIISDLGLPGINGYETLQQLHAIKADTPSILISGFFDPELQDDMTRTGIHAYIQKPFVPEKILATIRQVLSRDARPVEEFPEEELVEA